MIIIFLSVIALINYYIYASIVAGYPESSLFVAALIIFFISSLFAAIVLEKKHLYKQSLFFSWIGYTWLGVSCIALFASAMFDLLQQFIPGLSDQWSANGIGIIVTILTIASLIAARKPSIKHVHINAPQLEIDAPELTIVQISDLHLGDSSTIHQTRQTVETINQLEPDIIVSTGDLFDGFLPLMDPYTEALNTLKAAKGKFAISGNHEVYAGLEDAMHLTEKAGFTLLRNRTINLENNLSIIGTEDPSAPNKADESALLNESNPDTFKLLLKHRPDIVTESVDKFDLQLSGHTHGGQIFPFHLLVKLAYRAKPGLSKLGKRSQLYLSRGTGSWGPQMRLFANTEITCIHLTKLS